MDNNEIFELSDSEEETGYDQFGSPPEINFKNIAVNSAQTSKKPLTTSIVPCDSTSESDISDNDMDLQEGDSSTEIDEPPQNTEEKAAMREAVANAKAKKELEREEKRCAQEEQLRRHLEAVEAARESNAAHAAEPALEPIEIMDINTIEPDKSYRNTCLNSLRNVLHKRIHVLPTDDQESNVLPWLTDYNDKLDTLCLSIEEALWKNNSRVKYKMQYMRLYNNMGDSKNGTFFRDVLLGRIEPKQLATMEVTEMASEEKKHERQMEIERSLELYKKASDERNDTEKRVRLKKDHKGERIIEEVEGQVELGVPEEYVNIVVPEKDSATVIKAFPPVFARPPTLVKYNVSPPTLAVHSKPTSGKLTQSKASVSSLSAPKTKSGADPTINQPPLPISPNSPTAPKPKPSLKKSPNKYGGLFSEDSGEDDDDSTFLPDVPLSHDNPPKSTPVPTQEKEKVNARLSTTITDPETSSIKPPTLVKPKASIKPRTLVKPVTLCPSPVDTDLGSLQDETYFDSQEFSTQPPRATTSLNDDNHPQEYQLPNSRVLADRFSELSNAVPRSATIEDVPMSDERENYLVSGVPETRVPTTQRSGVANFLDSLVSKFTQSGLCPEPPVIVRPSPPSVAHPSWLRDKPGEEVWSGLLVNDMDHNGRSFQVAAFSLTRNASFPLWFKDQTIQRHGFCITMLMGEEHFLSSITHETDVAIIRFSTQMPSQDQHLFQYFLLISSIALPVGYVHLTQDGFLHEAFIYPLASGAHPPHLLAIHLGADFPQPNMRPDMLISILIRHNSLENCALPRNSPQDSFPPPSTPSFVSPPSASPAYSDPQTNSNTLTLMQQQYQQQTLAWPPSTSTTFVSPQQAPIYYGGGHADDTGILNDPGVSLFFDSGPFTPAPNVWMNHPHFPGGV